MSRRPRKSFALLIGRTLGTTHASTIASFIGGRSTWKKTSYPVCNASRYKKEGKKAPQKVVWYFPITPHKKSTEETKMEAEAVPRGRKVKNKKENYCPPSCFTLSPKEIDQFIKCLTGIKVSSGYCGKISRFLDIKKKVQRDKVS